MYFIFGLKRVYTKSPAFYLDLIFYNHIAPFTLRANVNGGKSPPPFHHETNHCSIFLTFLKTKKIVGMPERRTVH